MIYKIYTDGGCSGNGYSHAVGGWGYFIINEDNKSIGTGMGKETPSTNQRMELLAAIKALEHYKYHFMKEFPQDQVIVYSDSAYLINCVTQKWYINWQNNGWHNAKKEPVANQDLWEKLIPFFNDPLIQFKKVAGHSGNFWNEQVDQLTQIARLQIKETTNG